MEQVNTCICGDYPGSRFRAICPVHGENRNTTPDGYIWLREPTDGRDSRIEWTPPPGPYKVPAGYVHRDAIFRNHNCSRCRSGERACVEGEPSRCGWPHARND